MKIKNIDGYHITLTFNKSWFLQSSNDFDEIYLNSLQNLENRFTCLNRCPPK